MAAWIIALVAAQSIAQIATAPTSAKESAGQSAAPAQKPFHEFAQDISRLLKRESQSKTPAARAVVIGDMCALHGDIVHDPRYTTSDVLKEYRGRLWVRLTKVKTEIKQQLARQRNQSAALEDLVRLEAADSLSLAAADSLAATLDLGSQLQGGPPRLLALGGAPGAPDFGPDLVALIERTINPAFWDVNGGPGTIVYYRPLMCLVVTATSEVHAQIGGLAGDLRK